jgi:hypothetical protein
MAWVIVLRLACQRWSFDVLGKIFISRPIRISFLSLDWWWILQQVDISFAEHIVLKTSMQHRKASGIIAVCASEIDPYMYWTSTFMIICFLTLPSLNKKNQISSSHECFTWYFSALRVMACKVIYFIWNIKTFDIPPDSPLGKIKSYQPSTIHDSGWPTIRKSLFWKLRIRQNGIFQQSSWLGN